MGGVLILLGFALLASAFVGSGSDDDMSEPEPDPPEEPEGLLTTVLDDGTVQITGTDEADAVNLTADSQFDDLPPYDEVVIETADGNDTIIANADAQLRQITVEAGAGDDFARVNSDEIANIFGGEGNDTITGGTFSGVGAFNGGPGNDVLSSPTQIPLFGDEGNDTIDIGRDGFGYGGDGDDVLTGTPSWNAFASLRGEVGNDTLSIANSGEMFGGDGDDLLILRKDEDVPNTDRAYDDNGRTIQLTGGQGMDQFVINSEILRPIEGTTEYTLGRLMDFDASEDTLIVETTERSGAVQSITTRSSDGGASTEIVLDFAPDPASGLLPYTGVIQLTNISAFDLADLQVIAAG